MVLLSGPNISGNEWKYVKECLDTAWVSSVGSYVTQFENVVAEYAGAKFGVATANGTSALHISLILSGVEREDYVIVPNVTFVATLNVIKYTGANPILIDVDAHTWQMDLDLLEAFLVNECYLNNSQETILKKDNKRVKAIMPVHVLGNMVNMDRLIQLAKQYNIDVVEDATEALGSYYKGQHAGSFGKMGCFSFNGNKIITTGGGGVIVTNDESLAQKAKHLTTQAKSDSFEYVHDEIGYNYRLVNVLAAIGVAQMEQLNGFIQRKKEVDAYYKSYLKDLPNVTFQKVDEEVNANCWLFTFRTKAQKECLKYLNEAKLQSRPFWVPMNQLKMFNQDYYYHHDDVSNQIYQECLSIPCSSNINDLELEQVVEVIKKTIKGS